MPKNKRAARAERELEELGATATPASIKLRGDEEEDVDENLQDVTPVKGSSAFSAFAAVSNVQRRMMNLNS
jgi:hypothetical protein